jgi:phosphoketolase
VLLTRGRRNRVCRHVWVEICANRRTKSTIEPPASTSREQYLDVEATASHCARGIGVRGWASNDRGRERDLLIALAGDVATLEALAATALLRSEFPDLRASAS